MERTKLKQHATKRGKHRDLKVNPIASHNCGRNEHVSEWECNLGGNMMIVIASPQGPIY